MNNKLLVSVIKELIEKETVNLQKLSSDTIKNIEKILNITLDKKHKTEYTMNGKTYYHKDLF